MGRIQNVGLIIKVISLIIACIILIPSISVAIESNVSLDLYSQLKLSSEDKEKLEKISKEIVDELNNYTKDIDDILSKASGSCNEDDIEKIYKNLSEKLTEDFLSDDKVENSTIEMDNDTFLELLKILSEEIENFSERFNYEINEKIVESYQKEVLLRNKIFAGENNASIEEEHSAEQINTISIEEKDVTSLKENTTVNVSKLLTNIDKFLGESSLLRDLLTKTFYKRSPKDFSDNVNGKNVERFEEVDDGIPESCGITDSNSAIDGIKENDGFIPHEDIVEDDSISIDNTGSSAVAEESSSTPMESQDESTVTESPSEGFTSSLLWIESSGGMEKSEFKTTRTLGDNEKDDDIDYSLADKWYIYHSGDRVEIPLSLHSAVDLDVLSIERMEVISGENIFEVKPHFGGLDIGDVILLGILGYHLILLKFTIKALLLVGRGLLIPLILEKIYKFGWKVLSNIWQALFGVTFAGLLMEMYNNFISTLSKKVLPILGEYVERAIEWIVEYFIPVLANWLKEKAIPAIIEFIKTLPLIIYSLVRCVNIAIIKAMEIGEALYEAIKYLAIEVLGGSELTLTMGRVVVGSKNGSGSLLNIFDVMEMSPIVAYIRDDCNNGYAIVNLTVKSGNKIRHWLKVGIIIDNEYQSGDESGYEGFTSKYIPTTEQTTYSMGYNEGYREGYQQGYNDGYNDASSSTQTGSEVSSSDSSEEETTESSAWSGEAESDSTSSGGWGSGDNVQSDESENIPPVAVIDGPSSGTVGQVLTFTAEGSYDIDGTIVRYDWWYKGVWHNNLGDTIQIVFYSPIPHTKTIKVRVHDDDGNTDIATTTCYITLW